MHNKDLHKGVEFGARAAWEVTKEVAKKTARDTVNTLGEQALMGRLEKAGKVGKAIKSIFDNPAVVGLRQTGETADQIKNGIQEYPQWARDLGIRIKRAKREVYGK